jgi:hypothetical protein
MAGDRHPAHAQAQLAAPGAGVANVFRTEQALHDGGEVDGIVFLRPYSIMFLYSVW